MVLAILGLCTVAETSLIEAVRLANVAAGLEVERFGATAISRTEIADELLSQNELRTKRVSFDTLLRRIASHREAGESIVFTNGCFDLLHAGHVQILQEAAVLGDVLVVAVNSDASVSRLKGPERPVIAEGDRARLLEALACVDYVTVFEDATPHRLLEAIRPDVLMKGGTSQTVVGREVVEGYGGRIVQLGCVPDRSTTQIVNKLQRPTRSSALTEARS